MSISVLGPTFEDLALNVKKNISNISYIFIGRSAGYIGGSLIGGVLFDCMSPHLLLGKPRRGLFPVLATLSREKGKRLVEERQVAVFLCYSSINLEKDLTL